MAREKESEGKGGNDEQTPEEMELRIEEWPTKQKKKRGSLIAQSWSLIMCPSAPAPVWSSPGTDTPYTFGYGSVARSTRIIPVTKQSG